MRNRFLFLMLPTWMPLDAFSVKDAVNIESFLLGCPIDGRCSQCQPLVLFVQVLEKTL